LDKINWYTPQVKAHSLNIEDPAANIRRQNQKVKRQIVLRVHTTMNSNFYLNHTGTF
jgi:hypothetical protein